MDRRIGKANQIRREDLNPDLRPKNTPSYSSSVSNGGNIPAPSIIEYDIICQALATTDTSLNPTIIDGYLLIAKDFYCLTGQLDQTANGVYRFEDDLTSTKILIQGGELIQVNQGTDNHTTGWMVEDLVITSPDIVIIKVFPYVDSWKVKVSGTDTTENYLNDKILATGDGVIQSIYNSGSDEQVQLLITDDKVKIDQYDTTNGYLSDKLVEGNDITLTIIPGTGNKTLEISSTDQYVRVSGTDITEDYLSNKLVAGAGVNFTTLDPGGDEQIEISTIPSVIHQVGPSLTSSDNYINCNPYDVDISNGIIFEVNITFSPRYLVSTDEIIIKGISLEQIDMHHLVTDWKLFDGMRIFLSASLGYFFSIKNNDTECWSRGSHPECANIRCNNDLYLVNRCELQYKSSGDYWELISYTLAPRREVEFVPSSTVVHINTSDLFGSEASSDNIEYANIKYTKRDPSNYTTEIDIDYNSNEYVYYNIYIDNIAPYLYSIDNIKIATTSITVNKLRLDGKKIRFYFNSLNPAKLTICSLAPAFSGGTPLLGIQDSNKIYNIKLIEYTYSHISDSFLITYVDWYKNFKDLIDEGITTPVVAGINVIGNIENGFNKTSNYFFTDLSIQEFPFGIINYDLVDKIYFFFKNSSDYSDYRSILFSKDTTQQFIPFEFLTVDTNNNKMIPDCIKIPEKKSVVNSISSCGGEVIIGGWWFPLISGFMFQINYFKFFLNNWFNLNHDRNYYYKISCSYNINTYNIGGSWRQLFSEAYSTDIQTSAEYLFVPDQDTNFLSANTDLILCPSIKFDGEIAFPPSEVIPLDSEYLMKPKVVKIPKNTYNYKQTLSGGSSAFLAFNSDELLLSGYYAFTFHVNMEYHGTAGNECIQNEPIITITSDGETKTSKGATVQNCYTGPVTSKTGIFTHTLEINGILHVPNVPCSSRVMTMTIAYPADTDITDNTFDGYLDVHWIANCTGAKCTCDDEGYGANCDGEGNGGTT